MSSRGLDCNEKRPISTGLGSMELGAAGRRGGGEIQDGSGEEARGKAPYCIALITDAARPVKPFLRTTRPEQHSILLLEDPKIRVGSRQFCPFE